MIRAQIKKQTKELLRLSWKALPFGVRNRLAGVCLSGMTDMEKFLVGWPTLPGLLERACLSGMTEKEKFLMGLPTVPGLLESLRDNGFSPAAIIDVGANVGDWSRMAAPLFPDARVLMLEGNPENDAALGATADAIGSRSERVIALLGPEKKDAVKFYTFGTGSSVLPELTTFDKGTVTLPMDLLDNVVEGAALPGPFLLKLDVQGFELEVLKGGKSTLHHAEAVILESSLIPFNDGAPLFADVVEFMNRQGFVVFDFCGQSRRESDGALFQTDIAFVRRDSCLRTQRKFWLREP
jgi:FkbM family methyltransferase